MKSVLLYLLQVLAISGVLYGYYHLALRNNKFHRYNRFYLLCSLVLSISVPFLNIPVHISAEQTRSSVLLQTLSVFSSSTVSEEPAPVLLTAVANNSNGISWDQIAWIFYALVGSALLLRVFFSIHRIRRIIKSYPVERWYKVKFVNTAEPGTPFSFFAWLFWNNKIELRSERGQQIFRHELFHIKQKHSLDIVFLEVILVFFWINPFFHLVKKESKAIHEFLADQFAISSNKKWEYAELLLMHSLNTNQRLVNTFFHNQIKRRIAMITSSKQPRYQYLRKIIVLPIAALLILICGFTYKKINNRPESSVQSTQTISAINLPIDTLKPTKIIMDGDSISVQGLSENGSDHLKVEHLEFYQIKTDTSTYALVFVDGTPFSYQTVQKTLDAANIQSVKVLKGQDAVLKYGDNGKNGVIEILTKFSISKKETILESRDMSLDTVKPVALESNIVFSKVEIEPGFPGGSEKWRQYLSKNINSVIPVEKGAPEGSYTVIVQFIVDTKGNIRDIKPLTHHGYGMEEEATRLIAKGPPWTPAIQNSHIVQAYKKQAITFQVAQDSLPRERPNKRDNY